MTSVSALPRRETDVETSLQIEFPEPVFSELRKFLLDKCTGNVEINIRQGKIMGAKVSKHIKL